MVVLVVLLGNHNSSTRECYYHHSSDEGAEAVRGLVISTGYRSEQESHCGLNVAASRTRVNLHSSILLTLRQCPTL